MPETVQLGADMASTVPPIAEELEGFRHKPRLFFAADPRRKIALVCFRRSIAFEHLLRAKWR
jgi:hypothetical protein